MTRERQLAETFVEIADGLANGYDVVDFLHVLSDRCVEFLGVSEAGLMLSNEEGVLEVLASSSQRSHLLDLLQLQRRQGPCWEAYQKGHAVSTGDLQVASTQWPEFAARAMEVGFRSAEALPLRLRGEVLGALNLFLVEPSGMESDDLAIAQALADVATIGILQDVTMRRREETVRQLQGALTSRVAIEQAKGMVGESAQVDMETAFRWLRTYARNHNHLLSEVALDVISGTLRPADLRVVTGLSVDEGLRHHS